MILKKKNVTFSNLHTFFSDKLILHDGQDIYDTLAVKKITDDNKYSRGNIGFTFSLARILNKCVCTNKTIVMLEDDVCLAKKWNTFNAKKIPKKWDIFFFGWCYGYINRQVPPIKSDKDHNIVQLRGASCTHAFMIKPKIAKLILKNFFPIKLIGDERIRILIKKHKLKILAINPPIFYQDIKFESALRSKDDLEAEYKDNKNKFGPCKNK